MLMEGKFSQFDRAYAFGHQGELLVDDVLNQIAAGQGTVEIKRSSFPDLKLYVEFEHSPRGVYVPSGISVTTADYWAFVKPGNVFILTPTELLMREVRHARERGVAPHEEKDGSCPTRGYLVDARWLVARTVVGRAS